MTTRKENRLVRYPKFDISFITEKSTYNIKYDAKLGNTPSDNLMSESVISLTTKNAMEDDSAVFSFVLTGDIYWDRILSANDAVILRISPDVKRSSADQKEINDTILVGLVSEVRVEGDYGEDSKMYRISGQSFAKVFMDFEVGVIQEVSVVLSEIGWLPDDSITGIQFSRQNASSIAHSVIQKFLPYTKYTFADNRTVHDFLEYEGLDSWTQDEVLSDPLPFINYEGSLKQLLDDITEKPFNENFFDFTKDGKCRFIMRRTPFDKEDWDNLVTHQINSKAVISESVAKNDVEVASIFNVILGNPLGYDSVDFGSFPRYYQELVDKYGYTKLELRNKYLMTPVGATNTGLGDNGNVSDNPEGTPMIVEATAYSYKEAGLSTHTAMGVDLRKNPKVIAVDPTVIPLGTKVYIPGMGNYTAGDTGTAIKGKRIDIHMTSVEDCVKFGRKNLTIIVPEKSRSRGVETRKSASVDTLYAIVNGYLKAQSINTLRVRKAQVSSRIVAVDSRITKNHANKIIDQYTKKRTFTRKNFSDITGITDSNVEDTGNLNITYAKVRLFLKDYMGLTMKDKATLINALMGEYKNLTKDKANAIATTFLTKKVLTKTDYERAMQGSGSSNTGGVTGDVEASNQRLKTFSERIANWYAENGNFYSGEIKVVGNPNYRLGNRLLYVDEQNGELWEYYIEGVQHDYSYSSGFVTTLSVTRGLQDGGLSRFSNLWGKSKEFKGGLLGEKSLQDLYEEGKKPTEETEDTSGSTTRPNPDGEHDGSIASSGVYSYLNNIALSAIKKFGNMRITSGYRAGDPYSHGKRQAIDIAYPPSMNGSPKNREVANWVFETYPDEVAYVITNGMVRDRSGMSGTGSSGKWVRWADNDHYDHVHINGMLGEKNIRK